METQYTIRYVGQTHDEKFMDFSKGQRYSNRAVAEEFLKRIGALVGNGLYRIDKSNLYMIDEDNNLKWCFAFILEV